VVGVPLMYSALARICAVWLIILGVSPFTAPFSTCDLADLHAGGATDQSALIKADPAPDDSSALPIASSLATPLFGAVFTHPVVVTDRAAKKRISPTALRL
jgi:hypothetical protein